MRYFLNLEGMTKRISVGYRYPYKKSTPLHKVHFPENCHFQTEKSIENS